MPAEDIINLPLRRVDAAIVKAILMTHAELQDTRAIPSMEIIARLKRDEPSALEMIDTLVGQVADFEEDSEELRRIADLFPALM